MRLIRACHQVPFVSRTPDTRCARVSPVCRLIGSHMFRVAWCCWPTLACPLTTHRIPSELSSVRTLPLLLRARSWRGYFFSRTLCLEVPRGGQCVPSQTPAALWQGPCCLRAPTSRVFNAQLHGRLGLNAWAPQGSNSAQGRWPRVVGLKLSYSE